MVPDVGPCRSVRARGTCTSRIHPGRAVGCCVSVTCSWCRTGWSQGEPPRPGAVSLVLRRGANRGANWRRTERLRATPAVRPCIVVAGRGLVRHCPPLLHPSGRRFEPCRAHHPDQDICKPLTCGIARVVPFVVRTAPGVRTMATYKRRSRSRGRIEQLPSGSLRVVVYAGTDPLTGRRHFLREVIPAGPDAANEAEKAVRGSPARSTSVATPRRTRR